MKKILSLKLYFIHLIDNSYAENYTNAQKKERR